MRRVLDEIESVWGEYNDFDSLDYVGFIIEGEAKEIRESDWDNAEKELVDVAIDALRMLDENTDDPESLIIERLDERMDGHQEEIIEKYKSKYDNE